MRVLLVVVMFVVIVAALVFGPLLLLWSLNTLFGLGIAYSCKTWLAALLLGMAASPNVHVRKN